MPPSIIDNTFASLILQPNCFKLKWPISLKKFDILVIHTNPKGDNDTIKTQVDGGPESMETFGTKQE